MLEFHQFPMKDFDVHYDYSQFFLSFIDGNKQRIRTMNIFYSDADMELIGIRAHMCMCVQRKWGVC